MSGDTAWSLGVLIWLPIFALLLAVLTATAVLAFRYHVKHDGKGSYYGDALWIGIPAVVIAVGLIVGTTWGMYPYRAEYHQWRDVSGQVVSIDNRLIGTGDGMETKFVVRFDGSGQQYGCDDTRCASVREGDHLTLSCKRAWQYTGIDGYDCRFVSTEVAS